MSGEQFITPAQARHLLAWQDQLERMLAEKKTPPSVWARAPHDYLDALKSPSESWRRHVRREAPRRARLVAEQLRREWRLQQQELMREGRPGPGEIVEIAPLPAFARPWELLAIGIGLAVCVGVLFGLVEYRMWQ